MQETQSALPPIDFAGLLAKLAAPAPEPTQDWIDSALQQDVATLRYENALRKGVHLTASDDHFDPRPKSKYTGHVSAAPEPSRKDASITIRLSAAECAQLRERAAAAELSVSAYLRSCVFEAEALRTQVREVLSQLRFAASPAPHQSSEPFAPPATWLNRLFPHRPRAFHKTGA